MNVEYAPAHSGPRAATLPAVTRREDDVFRRLATDIGLHPDDPWVGGYVEYEWQHGRHVFETLGIPLAEAQVLEFGCNVGASAVVLAALGAQVTALDVDEAIVDLARANVSRYQMADSVRLRYTTDSSRLPFADEAFDLVCCNSVLEYIPHAQLPTVMAEISRVLKPGAVLLITGTSSRLWPREVHSGRWGVNWLPRRIDRLLGRAEYQRGVWPWTARYGFGPAYENLDRADRGMAWLEARQRKGLSGWKRTCLKSFNMAAGLLGTSAGLLTPNIALRMRKSGETGCAVAPDAGADIAHPK